MSFAWGDNDLDSDYDDEASEYYKSSGQALILIIDAGPNMFVHWGGNDEHPFNAAIKAAYTILRSKILSSPKDKVSILFYSTEQTKNSSDFPNLYVYQDLSVVKRDMISQLMKMIKDPVTLDGFQDKIGSSTNYDFKDIFWLAKIIFDDGDVKNLSKKIMLFTTEDNPHGTDKKLQDVVVQKFKDLGNVDFNLVPFRDTFDYTKFYSKLVEDEATVIKANDSDDLVNVLRVRQRLKRAYTKTMLSLAPELKIGVGVYTFVRKAYKPKKVKVYSVTNEVVNRTVNTFHSADGRPVLKSAQRKEINAGGETVQFSLMELKEMQYNFETGIKLMGFLDRAHFESFTWYRNPGYFLYPDEDKVSGSKDLFTSLLKRCDTLGKVAVVSFAMTRGQSPKLGILFPSMGNEARNGRTFPQGFHLVIVPFSDEIRHHETSDVEATPEMVSIMQKIVKKLTQRDFDVTTVNNPQLARMWKQIESLALDLPQEDMDEDGNDFTVPNVSLMEERIGLLPAQLQSQITMSGLVEQEFHPSSSSAAKKPRIEKPVTIDFDMGNEARHGRLSKLTCAVLQEFLRQNKLKYPDRARKQTLIDIINRHFGI